jgi:beta-galactosidase
VPTEWTAIVTKGDTAWRLSTAGAERKFHFPINNYDTFLGEANSDTTVNFNEWHQVTGVYDGNAIRLFVDGKLEATTAVTGEIARNEFAVLIGENSERNGRSFDGLIDDVRIYNYALPENEIKALAAGQ